MDEESNQITNRKDIRRKKCAEQVSGATRGRQRQQHKTELDGDKSFVAYASVGATTHKSSKVKRKR